MSMWGRERLVSRKGYTYLIQGGIGGPVKIGSTIKHPRERLAALQCGSPVPLAIVGVLKGMYHEPRLHTRFAHLRLHGEWFELDDDLIEFIFHIRVPGIADNVDHALTVVLS